MAMCIERPATRTKVGAARKGAPISPLLANLYMRRFVLGWKTLGHEQRFARGSSTTPTTS